MIAKNGFMGRYSCTWGSVYVLALFLLC